MFTFSHLKKTDGDEVKHYFNFVYTEQQTRGAAISSLIARRYSLFDEIALINNKLIGAENAEQEYADYMHYREEVKAVVDQSLQGYEAAE